ncbi:MAG TPA: hypothetical protein VM118_07745, partial [Acidobacteriota bacterium]|nr:hypothetical protein [Acidobacteriota bacterium]
MILSARSVWRSVLPVAAGLAFAACSGERSTEPEGPVPLTAIDLSTELVTGVSDWVEAQTLTLDEYTFALGDLPMVEADAADDVHVQFVGTWYAETFNIDVFVPDCDGWSRVENESLLKAVRVNP